MHMLNTKELIDRIFKEPGVKFDLTEFENLGKPIHDLITISPSDIDRFVVPLLDAGKQEAIGDLVRESLVKQQESCRLLEQAKTRVEQIIEEAVQP